MRPLLTLTVVLLGLAVATAPAALATPESVGRSVLSSARVAGLTPVQVAWIRGLVGRAPRPARDAIGRVAPYITFRRGVSEEISGGDHISTFVGATTLRFLVSLGMRTRATRDRLAAHLFLHELGHAVDNALVSDELRSNLSLLFTRSPVWQGCFAQPLGSSQRCVPSTEIFAEQFAFYAARDRLPRTTYAIPPLYRFRELGALLEQATGGEDTLLGLQLEDEAAARGSRSGA